MDDSGGGGPVQGLPVGALPSAPWGEVEDSEDGEGGAGSSSWGGSSVAESVGEEAETLAKEAEAIANEAMELCAAVCGKLRLLEDDDARRREEASNGGGGGGGDDGVLSRAREALEVAERRAVESGAAVEEEREKASRAAVKQQRAQTNAQICASAAQSLTAQVERLQSELEAGAVAREAVDSELETASLQNKTLKRR